MPEIALTAAAIAPHAPFRRGLADGLVPPPGFDDRTLLYDVFRTADGAAAFLLGPPAIGVEGWMCGLFDGYGAVRWWANDRHQRGLIPGAPDVLDLPGDAIVPCRLPVQPNLSARFAGRRVLLTLSRDNDLAWIADWAQWHAAAHGADAVLLYDNGSTRYGPDALRAALARVLGLAEVVVVPWPYAYGVTGISNFCQAVMLEHARRRFLVHARSVLNADIDELAVSDSGASIFVAVEASATGYVQAPGRYLTNAGAADPARRRHRDFAEVPADDPLSPPKWAVVPAACPDEAAWRPHFVAGMEASPAGDLRFRHFRAINTNWLEPRWQAGEPSAGADAVDAAWAAQAARIDWTEQEHIS